MHVFRGADVRAAPVASANSAQLVSNGTSASHPVTPAAPVPAPVTVLAPGAGAGGEASNADAPPTDASLDAEAAAKKASAKALGEENRIIARAQTIRVRRA